MSTWCQRSINCQASIFLSSCVIWATYWKEMRKVSVTVNWFPDFHVVDFALESERRRYLIPAMQWRITKFDWIVFSSSFPPLTWNTPLDLCVCYCTSCKTRNAQGRKNQRTHTRIEVGVFALPSLSTLDRCNRSCFPFLLIIPSTGPKGELASVRPGSYFSARRSVALCTQVKGRRHWEYDGNGNLYIFVVLRIVF